MFSKLSSDGDLHDLAVEWAGEEARAFELMSLLANDEIDDASNERFQFYGKCDNAPDIDECLSFSFAKIAGYLANGHYFSQLEIRTEDPANLVALMVGTDMQSRVDERLRWMIDMQVKREMDEEQEYD